MIQVQKTHLRKHMKSLLSQYGSQVMHKESQQIISLLQQSLSRYNVIALYLAQQTEPYLDPLIDTLIWSGKIVLVPWISTVWSVSPYVVRIYSMWDVRTDSAYRYVRGEQRSWDIDCIVLPWLAFTLDGTRLGRWGWWYDRMLARYPDTHKIWVCFGCQVVDELPIDEYDMSVDEVMTWV